MMLLLESSLFLLLLGLSSGTLLTEIDPTRCDGESACFVRGSCLEDRKEQGVREFHRYEKDEDESKLMADCDVMMQMSYLTRNKYHVMIQVKPMKNVPAHKINMVSLQHGPKQGFIVCKDGDPTINDARFKIEKSGDQKATANEAFYSFTVENEAAPIGDSFFSLAPDDHPILLIAYTITANNQKEELELESTWDPIAFWQSPLARLRSCWREADFFSFCPKKGDCVELIEKDDAATLSCPKGYLLKHSFNGKVHDNSTEVKCNIETKIYSDDKGRELPKNSSIYCISDSPKFSLPAVAETRSDSVPNSLGALFIMAAVVVAAIVAFIVVLRKRLARIDKILPPSSSSSSSKRMEQSQPLSGPSSAPIRPKYNAADALPALPSGPKGAWLARERRAKKKMGLKFDHGFWERFNEAQLSADVLTNFARLKLRGRKNVFYNLTALCAYAGRMSDRRHFGHLHHYFDLLKHCETSQMDSLHSWEQIFRFARLLEALIKQHLKRDTLNFADRLRTVLVAVARPIFTELGWKIVPGEHITDTRMRFLVVRVLAWAEQPDVIEELTRQADLPLDKLESPLRATVFGFAVRKLKRADDFKKTHWKTILDDPRAEDADKFGTIRQHLLFGLMTARDDTRQPGDPAEFKMMRDTLLQMYEVGNLESSFTPADFYWAYLGATEHYSNVEAAAEVYGIPPEPFDIEKVLPKQFALKNPGTKTPAQLARLKDEWKRWIVDTADLLAECCSSHKQYGQVLETMARYEKYLDKEDLDSSHDDAMFVNRSSNLESLFANPKVASNIIDFALKRIEAASVQKEQKEQKEQK